MEIFEPIPGGQLECLGVFGTDLDIINSARISYNKQHLVIEPGDDKLIDFLLRNRHGTPFEIPIFRFKVKAPLFILREWFRHRIASYNEVSGRYVELNPEMYLPDETALRQQIGKPGNYSYGPILDETIRDTILSDIDYHNKRCYVQYKRLLELGLAKELARIVLPLNMFSEMICQINARSLMNFISLRSAPTAMFEIRRYSECIETYFQQSLPLTYNSFVKYGKVAP